MQGDKPISYWKGDAADFTDPKARIKWVQLVIDPSVGVLKNQNDAGIVAFKISIKKRDGPQPINFTEFQSWKEMPPTRPPIKKVRAYIF
jgi:hypothetical protein